METEVTLNEVMEFLKDTMVTKEEAKNFATKDDLKHFATKDDLKNFATKDDLKNFATKNDIEQLRLDIKSEFESIHVELLDIKQSIVSLEKRTREDSDSTVVEVEALKKRVHILERQLKQLQSAN